MSDVTVNRSNTLALARARKRAEKLLKKRQWPEARAALQALCQQAPQEYAAWADLGEVCRSQGDLAAAEQAWQRALALRPELQRAHRGLAGLYLSAGRWALAEHHLRRCLKGAAGEHPLLGKLALALEAQGKLEEAESCYRRLLADQPATTSALLGLGRVVRQLGREAEAAALIEQLLAQAPELALAHLERGLLLRLARRYDEALAAFQRFRQLAPQERESYLLNCADLYAEQERYEAALDCYDEAVAAFPQSAYCHWGRALLLLKLGRYEEGWREFEWRRGYPDWQRQCAGFEQLAPQWRGETLAGKRVLVFAEQGFGDTLQFCRYLQPLAAQGVAVTFHCQPELLPLLAANLAGVTVVARDPAQARGFDCYLPLMSLAGYFDVRADRLDEGVPYLCAEPDKVALWADRLVAEGRRIGLVWAGSATNPLDRRRSFGLATYAPLKRVPGLSLFSLQKGGAEADGDAWQGVVDLGREIADFGDTAAIIANLDLVITTDTAVAHLAAAMGRPVWVLIYADPDWRWQAQLEGRNIWYPGVRLFRQRPGESWAAVVARLVDTLLTRPR